MCKINILVRSKTIKINLDANNFSTKNEVRVSRLRISLPRALRIFIQERRATFSISSPAEEIFFDEAKMLHFLLQYFS